MSARQAPGRRRPAPRLRATAEVGTQGRRSSGWRATAASLTSRPGGRSASTVTRLPACGLLGPAHGLGERQVVGHGEGTARQGAGAEARAAGARTGAEAIAALAPAQRNSAMHDGDQEVDDVGRRSPAPLEQRPASQGERRRRRDRPSRRRSCRGAWLPVTFQTAACSTRPPSSGSPGTRLRTPTSRLAPASRPSTAARSRPSGRDRPQRQRQQRRRRARSAARRPRSLTPARACAARPRSR